MKKLNTLRRELEGNHLKSISRMLDIEKAIESGVDASDLIAEAIDALNEDIKAAYAVIRPYSEYLLGMELGKSRKIKERFYAIDKANLDMKGKLQELQTTMRKGA